MKIHKAYTLSIEGREGKTDYKQTWLLLQKIKNIVRRTLSNIHVQVVEYSPTGDKTLISVDSEIVKYGWKDIEEYNKFLFNRMLCS